MSPAPHSADQSAKPSAWPWQWGIAALLATGLRVGLMAAYGILQWPDSSDYIVYAERLLQTPFMTMLTDHFDLYNFRTIGYPAYLAAAMAIGGEDWLLAAVGGQLLLSLGMLWALYRLGTALGLGRGLAAIAAGIFSCSHGAVYDGSILTDAMFSHLFIIVICAILVPVLECGAIGIGRVVLCGCGMAIAILIRDATLYMIPVIAVGLVVVMRERAMPGKKIAVCIAVFVLPIVVVWQAYAAWNAARFGKPFVTTVGQSVYLLHPLEIEGRGRAVLQDPLLREAYNAVKSHYTYGIAVEMNRYLAQQYGMTAVQRAELSQAAYWAAWRHAPDAMFMEMVRELRLKFIVQIADLSMALRDYPVMGGIEERVPVYARNTMFILGATLFRALSGLIVGAGILGVPLIAFVPAIRRAVAVRPAGLVFCWLVFAAMTGMYSMIHVELRYTLPVQAFIILSGIAMLRHAWLFWWLPRSAAVPQA